MITIDDLLGKWACSPDCTPERIDNATRLLLPAVAALELAMLEDGVIFPINPATGNQISGQTLGGFRPQVCSVGAARSNHKEGLAVDRYDPDGKIDAWCMANLDVVAACGIWLEHPSATSGWSHWQCVAPRSGRRVFMP